ncbi:hypothetical protein ACIPUB_11285 [Paeniglutamicibacter sp. ORCA_105]|uniref:hypothetical protein n=1 Tax=Paeniglutamicibacter sp. ORCA_105 TaxID=3377336 RepID=UPI0038952F62
MMTNLAGAPAAWPAPRIGASVRTRAPRAPAPVLYARSVAALAVAMGVGHLWIMAVFPHGPWVATVLGAMVMLCLKCAHRAWNKPAALVELLAMSALMALAHTFMALGIPVHVHGGDGPVAAATAGPVAMLGVAAAELVLVMLCGIGMRLGDPRITPGGHGAHS